MRRFVPVLKRINERLVLPQPQKYRIMKEIAADLEDTFAVYLQQGLGEEEAEAKALEKVAADDKVIEQLMEIHETPVRKILRRLSEKMRYRIEIGLWISLLFIVGVLLTRVLLTSGDLAGSSFTWIIGALIIGMVGISISKYYEIFIKRDHALQHIYRGLPLLIFLCGMVIVTGTLGFFVELQESMDIMARSGGNGLDTAVIHLFRSFTVICFAFASAIAGAVVWLILTMKILNIEDQEHTLLFSETEQ